MTLIDQYEAAIACKDIDNDPRQREVITHLQRVVDALDEPQRSFWFRFSRRKEVRGLYLHGPVGVGKTYLMDLFYQCVTETHKLRFHFHEFMQQIDAQLRRLQGEKDPVRRIAGHIAKKCRLLCLDEFLVHDVADAMILSELLQALFFHRVVLVATSNTPPDDLYLNGVQRVRFLPAIALVKEHCEILLLPEDKDYRLGRASLQEAYLCPLDDNTLRVFEEQFAAVSDGLVVQHFNLLIQNRFIPCVKCAEPSVWFLFDVICNLPRSQLDYLEIADRFSTVFVSDVPQLTANDTVRVLLLIYFVDVMYDKGIRLVISAAVPLEQLYEEGEMIKTFQRTLSRLEEMQSSDYLRRNRHRAKEAM